MLRPRVALSDIGRPEKTVQWMTIPGYVQLSETIPLAWTYLESGTRTSQVRRRARSDDRRGPGKALLSGARSHL